MGSCANALSAKKITGTFPVMYYGVKPKPVDLGTDSDFFTNSNPVLCPVKDCVVVAEAKVLKDEIKVFPKTEGLRT
jgi:hypothetical protein